MKFRKYTEEQLKEAVKASLSYRQVLEKLNIIPAGGNYQTLKKAISFLKLNTSHFTGRAWNKGRTFAPKRPISDYLSNEFPIQSYKLKNRLIKERILEPFCHCCSLDQWNDKQIPLELHHLDGNTSNNILSNLCLLCPNCHAQTDNYRAKNVSS